MCCIWHVHVQFCLFDKADVTIDVQWHWSHLLPLWYHFFSNSEYTSYGCSGLVDRKNHSNMCCLWDLNTQLPMQMANILSTRPGTPLWNFKESLVLISVLLLHDEYNLLVCLAVIKILIPLISTGVRFLTCSNERINISRWTWCVNSFSLASTSFVIRVRTGLRFWKTILCICSGPDKKG